MFSGSPIKRIGRDRFLRNVLIAIGNSGEPELTEAAMRRLEDASPIVRGAAIWALSRLLDRNHLLALRERALAGESDGDVIQEWDWAMTRS